jgi:hypothetical protein
MKMKLLTFAPLFVLGSMISNYVFASVFASASASVFATESKLTAADNSMISIHYEVQRSVALGENESFLANAVVLDVELASHNSGEKVLKFMNICEEKFNGHYGMTYSCTLSRKPTGSNIYTVRVPQDCQIEGGDHYLLQFHPSILLAIARRNGSGSVCRQELAVGTGNGQWLENSVDGGSHNFKLNMNWQR